MRIGPFEHADTAQLTTLLHRAYFELRARGLNFTAVDTVQWPGKTYRSVIMTREL